jgi:hypothetical protein
MYWSKIVGNFLVAFCTASLAISFVSTPASAISAGLIAALLQGLLAVGAELQQEDASFDDKGKICPTPLKILTLF